MEEPGPLGGGEVAERPLASEVQQLVDGSAHLSAALATDLVELGLLCLKPWLIMISVASPALRLDRRSAEMRVFWQSWPPAGRRGSVPHRDRQPPRHPEDTDPPATAVGIRLRNQLDVRKGDAVFEVGSSTFSEGDTVPTEFTCDGDDVSPPLSWSGVPVDAAELRISLTDPDAPGGTFTHWLVAGIDPSTSDVGQGKVPAGGTEEMNSFGERAYGGPCPPSGDNPHRYVFTVEALDEAGDVLASAELTTTYGR